MKKAVITALTALLLTAALTCAALGAQGLAAFEDTRAYESGMFTDVAAGSWYENGVGTVYAKGIMEGMGGGSFAPTQSITWAQAVTIAARLNATYAGGSIPRSTGAWYEGYMDYAREAGLLPSTCPRGTAVTTTTISRQELAGLFCQVLEESDLPAVNGSSIPDLDTVDEEFREAVEAMYAAGIFTGKTGGVFDPAGTATRGEIATIVTRLLLPGRRVSWDARANQIMLEQEGNLQSGGLAVMVGDVTYYTYKARVDDDTWEYTITGRRDAGRTQVVYATGRALEYMSAGDDGRLYFCEENDLRRLDPATGKVETLYSSRYGVECYTVYGGQVYLLEMYAQGNDPEGWRYRLGRVNSGSLEVYLTGLDRHAVLYTNALHAFNGKLYFVYADETYKLRDITLGIEALWSLDLTTKEMEKLLDEVFMGEIGFYGGTAWVIRRGQEDGEPRQLLRFSLLRPELTEVAATMPESASKNYTDLYANGEDVYYQSSGAVRLWHISSGGAVTEVARLETGYIEHSTVVSQGIITHALRWIKNLFNGDITVQLPDGEIVSYPQFLNKPYCLTGDAELTATDNALFWESSGVTAGEVTVEKTGCYYTDGGDLVVEVNVANGLGQEIRLFGLELDVTVAGQDVAWRFEEMGALKTGEEQTLSLVFPAALVKECPVEDVETQWELKYILEE